jgi:hypothetical protein
MSTAFTWGDWWMVEVVWPAVIGGTLLFIGWLLNDREPPRR